MSGASPREHRLLRLCIGLKVLMWAAIATTLVIGIWDIASGRQAGPPMALVWSIPVLVGLQALSWFAWHRLWKARLGKGES